MAVTVPFLFEVSRSKNFDRILNEVVGGIGKLSDEAKKASEKIDDLVGGKFKNVPLTSMFRDLNEAINSGDIDNINSKLEETGRILSSLEMKVDDTALKNLEKLTQTQVDEILKSVTKKGSNSAVIKKMINDRATKNASGGGNEKDLSEFKKYLVTAEEARKKLKELQSADVIKKEDINGIKDFVGYYERLVQLNEKITDNTITDDLNFIMGNFDKDNKYSFAGGASGKKRSILNLSELQEIQSGVKQISQVEGMVNENVSVSADGMGEAAQEIRNAAASLKEAASDLKGSAQSMQDSANSLNNLSGRIQGTSELSAEQAEAIRNIISAIGQQGDAVGKVQKQEEQVNNQLDEQLEKEKKINEEKQKIKNEQQVLYKNRDLTEAQLKKDKNIVGRLKEVLEYEPKKYTTHQDVQNTLEALSAVINNKNTSKLRKQAAMVDYTKSLQDVRKTKFRTPFPKNVLKEFENVEYNLSPDELKEIEDFLSRQYKAGSNQIKREEEQLKVLNDTIEQNKRRIIELNKQLENLKNGYDETSNITEDSTELAGKQESNVSKENVENDTQQINENTNAIIANTNARKENEEQTRRQYTAEEALDTISERFSAKDYYKDATANEEAIQEEAKFFQSVTQSRPKLLKEMNAEVRDLKKEIKPVDEMIKRIKEGSSLSKEELEFPIDTAKKLDDIIGKTNDGKHMEEYVTAMLKMNALLEHAGKEVGGVKGSGAKNKIDLKKLILSNFASASEGTDFSRSLEALFGDKRLSLFDGKNIKSMDQLAGMVLGDDLRTDKFDRISDVRERLSALKDAIKFMKDVMKDIQNAESQATSESGGEDGLSGYWNIKIRSMESGIQSYQDKLKTDGDNLVKTIIEESKAIEEAERQFSEATAFMLDNSDMSTGGTSAGGNNKSQSTVDLLAKQALERANKESINIQRDAERMANKGVSNAEQYKMDALEKGRQAIHNAIQDVIDEEVGQAYEYYISNIEASGVDKVKHSKKDADKASNDALIKANKDEIDKRARAVRKEKDRLAKEYTEDMETFISTLTQQEADQFIEHQQNENWTNFLNKQRDKALKTAGAEARQNYADDQYVNKLVEKGTQFVENYKKNVLQQAIDFIDNVKVEDIFNRGTTQASDYTKKVQDENRKIMDDIISEMNKELGDEVESIAKDYDSLTKKATKVETSRVKSKKTPGQIKDIDEFDALYKEAEERYNQLMQSEHASVESIQRVIEARRKFLEELKRSQERIAESQEQKDAEAAAKLAEQNARREERAELTANRKVISSVKKDVRDAEKYLGSMEGSKLFDTDEGMEFGKQLANIKSILDSIGNVDIINDSDTSEIARIREEADKLKIALGQAKESGSDLIDVSGSDKAVNTLANINKLMQNGNVSNEQFMELSRYKELLEGKNINTSQLDAIANSYSKINSEVKKGSTVIDAVQGKFKSLVGYMLSFASFYRIIGTIKQMATTVREFDDAFTEMRKVSDESVETLKAYQKESYDMASSVGTDALSLQKSTADFLRLGQSLEEAKDSARSANILMNVSEFSSIDQATESLIAMKAAYQDLGNMDIIDKLNKVGNDFSISTDQLATALQASAASLVNAGNDMDQAVALITAGNAVVQDASKVGAGLRTIALRIRGTKEAKQELEEMGEETETFIETQSKLRETILNATKVKSNNYMGFDILKDNGSYKSTYEIMLGISKVYKEILEQDEKTGGKQGALLLETLAGKTRSNIAASILSNGEMLEKAYNESAFESVNSAIIENEKYLDSLSGHLAQLKTAWQELQTTMMDSNFLKGLTDLGTGTLKGATGLFSQLSPTSLLMTIMGGVAGINGLSPIQFDRYGKLKPMFGASNKDTKAFVDSIRSQLGKMKPQDWDISGFGEEGIQIDTYVKMRDIDIEELEKQFKKIDPSTLNIAKEMHENGGSIEDFTKRIEDNQTAWSQLKSVAVGTIASMIASFGISLGVDFIQKLIDAPKAIASAAVAAGNEIKNQITTIDDYRDKVEKLYETINDPTASIEEQTNARMQLLDIQNELIANYGSEASSLTAVASSAEGAADAFNKLAQAQYEANMRAFKNDENSGVIARTAHELNNTIEGYKDNVDRMVQGMEEQSITELVGNDVLSRNQELKHKLEELYKQNNLEVDWAAAGDHFATRITGTAQNISNALKDAKQAIEEYKYSMTEEDYEAASNRINAYADNIDEIIAKYGELYRQRTYFENIAGNEEYKQIDEGLKDFYSKYKDAYSSGDKDAADEAAKNFISAYNSALEKAGSDPDSAIALTDYFENLYSSMASVMGEHNFKNDFDKNFDGIRDSIKSYLSDLEGMSSDELLKFTITDKESKESKAWSNLDTLANNYKMTIQQLIPILEDMGLVQSKSYQDLLSNFKDYQYQISNMSQEELQIAYRIYAEGMTFEELHERIEQEKGLIEIGFDIHDRSGLEAYNEIASNQKSYHADYDQYRQMMEDAKKLREEGRIGEEQFKQAAKLFSENGMTDYKNWDENYKALSKYFTEGSAGAEAFAKDIVALGKEFATINEDGGIDLNLDNMGELAEKLHMPMEMLQVLLENLRSFGATPDYFGNMEDGQARLNELYKQRADTVAKIEQMEKDGTTDTAYEQAKQDLEDINKSINTVTEGMDNLVEDAKNFNKETSSQYQSNKTALQSLLDQYNDLNKNHKEDESYQYQKQALEEAINAKSEEFSIPIKFEGDKASIDDSLKKADEKIQKAKDKLHAAKTKIEVDPSEVEEAENELKKAIEEKQKLEEPAIMKVDTSQYNLDVDDANAITTLQEFMKVWNELQSLYKQQELGIEVDQTQLDSTEAKADELAGKLQEMGKNPVLLKMGIDTTSGDKNQIAPQVQNVDVSKVNETLGNIENPTVTFDGNTAAFDTKAKHVKVEMTTIDALRANPVINASVNGLGIVNALATAIRNLHDKTITVTTKRTGVKVNGGTVTEQYGTAHARGTAYATHGDWGAKKDETALVGELGSELRVRGSRWDLLGENGTEFADIRKGDIIFSAQQTEELLKYGKILNGKRRGKALASGTAYASPNAGGGGSSLNFVKEIADRVANAVNSGGKKSGGGNSGGGNKDGNKGKGRKKGSSGKSTKKKSDSSSLEIFDWIELKIETIEREIKKLDITAQSVFKDWEVRGDSLASEISKVTEEIEVQRQAIKKYKNDGDVKKTFKDFKVDYKTNYKGKNSKKKNKANRKKNKKNKKRNQTLQDYMEIIRDGGKVEIDSIKDDKLAEKVRNYQEWITKSREAEVAVDELTEKLAELNAQNFDNVQKKYEDMIAAIEHESNKLEEEMSKNSFLGNVLGLSNNNIIAKQDKQTNKRIALLKEEAKELEKVRDEMTIKDGASEKEIEEGIAKGYMLKGSEKWNEMTQKINDARLQAEQASNELLESNKQKFDNIQSAFETQISQIQSEANMINEKINQVQERGFIVSKQFYEDLKANEQQQINAMVKQRDALIKQTNQAIKDGSLAVGSEEWYRRKNEIDNITASIEQGTTQLIEYNNAIRDLDWQQFDRIRDRVDDIVTESEFLVDLLSNRKLYEESGKLTKQGMASLGSMAVSYNVHMEQANAYKNEMLAIEKELKKAENEGNQTLIDRRNELLEKQRASIKAAEDEKQAIKNFVKDGIDLEIDHLKELIDTYKDSLNAERDLLSYQNNIKDKTKEISSIQKQLTALQGDDSEDARARRQKLEEQLEDAKGSLQEIQYERFIDDQSDLLDDLADKYSEALNKRLDAENLDELVKGVINSTNANAKDINETLKAEAYNVGYKITSDLTNIWNKDGKANQVVSTYSKGVADSINAKLVGSENTTVSQTIRGVESSVKNVSTAVTGIYNQFKADLASQKNAIDAVTKAINNSAKASSSGSGNGGSGNGGQDNGEPKKDELAKLSKYLADYKVAQSKATKLAATGSPTQFNNAVKEMNNILKLAGVKDITELIKKIEKLEKKNNNTTYSESFTPKYSQSFKKAATGVRRVPKDENYWTQEFGTEAIIRRSDGAILTPLNAGDSVLNKSATDNLWKFTNNPSKFIRDNFIGGALSSISSTNGTNFVQNIDNITFSMPNVKNYEQLISQMQNDKSFEKLILSMSVDRLAGGSSLGKYKALR